MAIPAICQTDGTVGFHWLDTAGRPAWLVELFAMEGAEPLRLDSPYTPMDNHVDTKVHSPTNFRRQEFPGLELASADGHNPRSGHQMRLSRRTGRAVLERFCAQ